MDEKSTEIVESPKNHKDRNRFLRLIIEQRPITLGITIIITIIIMGIIYKGKFLSFANLSAAFGSIPFDIITACGMTILLIGGLIDLSVGSVMSLAGAVTAYALKYMGFDVVPAILLGLLAALAVGAINGVVVAKVGVNPLITTIATMGAVSGIAVITVGMRTGSITGLPYSFGIIGQFRIFNFILPFWIMIVIVALLQFLLFKGRFFRKYYYIGDNSIAAKFSGINVDRWKFIAFLLSAGLAGVSGILFAARISSAVTTIGLGAELRVLTACVLGGAALSGGKGSIFGSFLGVVFLALINNILLITGVSVIWYSVVTASILLLAVSVDAVLSRRNL
jgi:ribose transport system permease protein